MDEPFIHPQALCESDDVGAGTRIWAFAHLLPGAIVGRDCNICDGVFIENGAILGDRVTVKSGVQVWDGVSLGDDVFVGPNATFTNDRMPRSRVWHDTPGRTIVHDEASIGANATILPDLEIGRGAMVGAGAVVTRSVPAHAIVVGNPARITGYTDSRRPEPTTPATNPGLGRTDVDVDGVFVTRSPQFTDLGGSLTAGELNGEPVPFMPKRYFLRYGVPSRAIRREHAHRECAEFMIAVSGSVTVAVDDGRRRREVDLNDPNLGIYIPPMVWASQFRCDAGSVLLVLASHPYDPDDYIREYEQFRTLVLSP
jgi:UDP-2-acetamido-3-amino-2,3-dideoxy-glucuronate N-acetyltransferase